MFLLSHTAIGCIACNRNVQEKIYDSSFLPNILMLLSAFVVLAIIVLILAYFSNRKHAAFLAANPGSRFLNPVPLTTASVVLGIGIGGFIDGIVLHQILQWHEMISNRMPPDTLDKKTVNMFWDGIFHLFTLTVSIVGIILLWKLLKRPTIDTSGRLFGGGLLMGWGIFNIVEGVIDHHLLELHYVRDITPHVDLYNYGFLLISVVMLVAGYFIAQKRPTRQTAQAES